MSQTRKSKSMSDKPITFTQHAIKRAWRRGLSHMLMRKFYELAKLEEEYAVPYTRMEKGWFEKGVYRKYAFEDYIWVVADTLTELVVITVYKKLDN